MGSNEEIVEEVKGIIIWTDVGNLFTYAKPGGALWQRQAAVEVIKEAGYETTENKILFSNGGQNALAAIFSGVFKAGDKIGVDPLHIQGWRLPQKCLEFS